MIADAIESVLAQGYDRWEHIIADGGSTDGTLDVLKRYPHLRVISEPDKGIYDALNKGLALAQGEIVGHLNSDDVYQPGAFSAVAAAFTADKSLDSVCGGAIIDDGKGEVIDCSKAANKELTFANALLGGPVINARFFTRAFYGRAGSYDQAYPLAGDRDFLVKAILAGCRSQAIDAPIYVYRMHDGSWTFNRGNSAAERLSKEYCRLAKAWLDRPDSPDDLRRQCRRLYGNSIARLAWLHLRRRDAKGVCRQLLVNDGEVSWRPLAAALGAVTAHVTARREA